MAEPGSVTCWIHELKAGEDAALGELYARYQPLLLALARRRLPENRRRAADEEDVAQEAFFGFYQSLKAGNVPRLEDRHHLLALLVVITARKAATLIDRECRKKRGGGTVQGESAIQILATSSDVCRGMDRMPGKGQRPEDVAMLEDSYRHYIDRLPEKYRPCAELYLAGCSTAEIAGIMECSERTVNRRMENILRTWRELAAESLTTGM